MRKSKGSFPTTPFIHFLRLRFILSRIKNMKLKAKLLLLVVVLLAIHGYFLLIIMFPNVNLKFIMFSNRTAGCEFEKTLCKSPLNSAGVSSSNNLWIRVDNSIYLYSAYLDKRLDIDNRARRIKSSIINEEMSVRDKGSSTFNTTTNSSSNSDQSVIIRIIGLLKVQPRSSAVYWLHVKEETYLGHRYLCKIFYTSKYLRNQKALKNKNKMRNITGSLLTYKIFEEGIRNFAGTFFNCYLPWKELVEIEKKFRLSYVALYPLGIEQYPAKLVPISSVSIFGGNKSNYKVNNDSGSSPSRRNKLNLQRGSSTLENQDKEKEKSNSNSTTISICIRPLFGPFEDLPKLVQFISYYSALGVSSFTFYNLASSPQILDYLNKLSSISKNLKVHLNVWNLPTGNPFELWDYGSLAALNDCFLQNFPNDWIIIVDLDEFIVPQRKSIINLHDLFAIAPATTVQILIRNTFFCSEFCSSSSISTDNSNSIEQILDLDIETQPNIHIFNCTNRTKRVWNSNLRAKYVIQRGEKVLSLGHHKVTEYIQTQNNPFDAKRFKSFISSTGGSGEQKSYEFSPNTAVLNHYRTCQDISTKQSPILSRLTTQDEKILRFERSLKNSIPYQAWLGI